MAIVTVTARPPPPSVPHSPSRRTGNTSELLLISHRANRSIPSVSNLSACGASANKLPDVIVTVRNGQVENGSRLGATIANQSV